MAEDGTEGRMGGIGKIYKDLSKGQTSKGTPGGTLERTGVRNPGYTFTGALRWPEGFTAPTYTEVDGRKNSSKSMLRQNMA